jgi:hypothetical protein
VRLLPGYFLRRADCMYTPELANQAQSECPAVSWRTLRRWHSCVVLGRLTAWLLILGLAALLVSPPQRVHAASVLWVDFHAGRLSMNVTQSEWRTVLQEVVRRTGIRLHLALPLDGEVTTSFADLPIERALKQLFGPDANFIFLYPHQPPSPAAIILPAEVWVIGGRERDTASTGGPPGHPAARAAVVPEPSTEPSLDIDRAFDRQPQLAHEAALSAPEVEQRLRAIMYLGQHITPEAVSVLVEVLRHDDPHVRRSAVEALGPLAGSDPQVQQALLQVLQTAAEAEVRELVTNMLGDLVEPAPEWGTAGSDAAGR